MGLGGGVVMDDFILWRKSGGWGVEPIIMLSLAAGRRSVICFFLRAVVV